MRRLFFALKAFEIIVGSDFLPAQDEPRAGKSLLQLLPRDLEFGVEPGPMQGHGPLQQDLRLGQVRVGMELEDRLPARGRLSELPVLEIVFGEPIGRVVSDRGNEIPVVDRPRDLDVVFFGRRPHRLEQAARFGVEINAVRLATGGRQVENCLAHALRRGANEPVAVGQHRGPFVLGNIGEDEEGLFPGLGLHESVELRQRFAQAIVIDDAESAVDRPVGSSLGIDNDGNLGCRLPRGEAQTTRAEEKPANAASPAKIGRRQARQRQHQEGWIVRTFRSSSQSSGGQTPSAAIVPPLIRPRSHARGGRSFSVLARLLDQVRNPIQTLRRDIHA